MEAIFRSFKPRVAKDSATKASATPAAPTSAVPGTTTTATPANAPAAAPKPVQQPSAVVPTRHVESEKKAHKKSIAQLFENPSLEYGPAPEDASVANAWLDAHNRDFGLFIGGRWVTPAGRSRYTARCPADNQKLAEICQGEAEDVDNAVNSAKGAYESWSKTPGHVRARIIYSIARHVQKHARLFAVIESLDNGKPIRETRDADVEIVARHLYHYAGWAELMDTELSGWKSLGVIPAIVN